MIVFLTSSPSGPLDKPNYDRVLDESNGFVENLKNYWKKDMKGLMIVADPFNDESNEEMTCFFFDAFRNIGLPVSFDLCDARNHEMNLKDYDIIMLAGGHVPTQNAFFTQIGLRERIKEYQGIVIGVSAGSMNSADIVYAQPELPGESIDLTYQKYLTGLNLTKINVCPHYQMVKDYYIDGKRLFEEITYQDSDGKSFITLNDGSYILIKDGITYIYGQANLIKDGKLTKINDDYQRIEYK